MVASSPIWKMASIGFILCLWGQATTPGARRQLEQAVHHAVLKTLQSAQPLCPVDHVRCGGEALNAPLARGVAHCRSTGTTLAVLVVAEPLRPTTKTPDVSFHLNDSPVEAPTPLFEMLAAAAGENGTVTECPPVFVLFHSTYRQLLKRKTTPTAEHMEAASARFVSRLPARVVVAWVRSEADLTVLIDPESDDDDSDGSSFACQPRSTAGESVDEGPAPTSLGKATPGDALFDALARCRIADEQLVSIFTRLPVQPNASLLVWRRSTGTPTVTTELSPVRKCTIDERKAHATEGAGTRRDGLNPNATARSFSDLNPHALSFRPFIVRRGATLPEYVEPFCAEL